MRFRPGQGESGGSSARPAQVPADGIAVGVVLALAGELFQRACVAILGKSFEDMIPDAADLEQIVSSGPAELRDRVPGKREASQEKQPRARPAGRRRGPSGQGRAGSR
jgi:hypothetical protein